MSAVLDAIELYRFYHTGDDETLALRGVSLAVEAGEVVAVTGPSGSGKSTLLACLAGLDDPDGGVVRIDGELMSRRPETERARLRARRVGVMFQSANLVEHLTVADNVILAQRLGSHVDRDQVHTLLESLQLSSRASTRPSELSGGESARAALAVALANEPAVVLADEPTGELDATNAARVVQLLRGCAERGAAVVAVTHNEFVGGAADRRVALRDGQVIP